MSDYKDDLKEALEEMESQILEEVEEVETKFDKFKKHMKNFYNENKCLFHFAGGLVVGVLLTEALSKDKVIPVIVEEPLKMLEKKLTSDTELTINLDEMRVTKVRETQSRLTGNDLFVVYREDKDQNTFITLFEEVKGLKYNAKEYDKYVEEQSKKLLDDTKK